MALDQKDLDAISSIIQQKNDETCTAIARAFERFDEHLQKIENGILERAATIEKSRKVQD